MLALQSPNTHFPPVELASPDGLLSIGGELTTEWLLESYTSGIFPWPLIGGGCSILAWYSPDPRAIIEFDQFHVSRRLHRRIRSGRFRVSINEDFSGVIEACGKPRKTGEGTWITDSLAHAFQRLHELGFAHSVEVWSNETLVGGLYGISLGGFFAGESMFYRERDASKVALTFLVNHLRQRGFCLFDVQQSSSHLASLGAIEIPRRQFIRRLRKSLQLNVTFTDTSAKNW